MPNPPFTGICKSAHQLRATNTKQEKKKNIYKNVFPPNHGRALRFLLQTGRATVTEGCSENRRRRRRRKRRRRRRRGGGKKKRCRKKRLALRSLPSEGKMGSEGGEVVSLSLSLSLSLSRSLSLCLSLCLSLSPALAQSGGAQTFRWYRGDRSSWRSRRYAETLGTHVNAAENHRDRPLRVCALVCVCVCVYSGMQACARR